MAARRSRIQIKPNIGGKVTSGPKRGQLIEENNTAVSITPELAAGAATAINIKRGPGSSKTEDNTKARSIEPSVQLSNRTGDQKVADGVDSNNTSGSQTENATKVNSKKDTQSVSFTRLKRFGINLGSKSLSRIDTNTDNTNIITSPKKNTTSPVYSLQKSVTSPPQSPQKSVNISLCSPQKNVPSTSQSPQKSNTSNEVLENDLQISKKLPVTVARKGGSIVPKIPTKRNVSSLNLKVGQSSESVSSSQSPLKSNQEISEKNDQSHFTDNSKLELEKTTVKPPSVIQRLPFRTRLPKVKPNIDALRLKNKVLHGSKEDNSSRPSSPLKSPKAGRFFSPIKSPRPVHKAVSPDVDIQYEKSVTDDLDIDKEEAPEGRKRHFSNTSISTINSDVQGTSKNVKHKPLKGDLPSDLDRNCMKMGDLVYWNPIRNQMASVVPPKKKVKQDKEKENVFVEETNEAPEENKTDDQEDGEDMPVPQVKIGPDGSIILNEESIVIKKQDDNLITEVIEENENTATYGSFRKPQNRMGWSEWETDKFYRALSYLGTDFSLMIKVFPNRSRCDIKAKFKKEDKYNKNKVDLALKNKKTFNMSFFKEEEELDKKETERKKRENEEKLKKSKLIKAEKQREKKKLKGNEASDLPVMRENYRSCRDRRKRYFEEDENDGDTSEIDSVMGTPIKTPIRMSFKRRDSLPFVPPFCLSQEEDSDAMETQVNMSDSEILSPHKPSRSEVTQVADNIPVLSGATLPPNANIQVTTDANNSPLVLVYHTPEDGKGETVIHVYQLQNHQIGNASHIQIPLNDGAGVLELPNMQTSLGNNVTSVEQEEQSESTSTQESLPFIIASGDENPPALLSHPVSEENETENDEFINVIDINASKIKTPKKNGKDENSENTNILKGNNSVYQAESLNLDNVDSDDSRTSSPPVVIDNEFVATDQEMYLQLKSENNIQTKTENDIQPIKKQGRRKR